MDIGEVGSKGELIPPKVIREQLGLISGQKVLFRICNGSLIIEKLLEPQDILTKPMKAIVCIGELKKNRLKLSEDALK